MEFIKLNTICNFKQWHTIPTKELKDTGYPVYGANGIIGYSDKYNHEEPTIMICCRGATCGAINVSQGKCYINGNAMAMDNLSKNYDIDYVSYYLKHYDFSSIITGAAQPQITQVGLEKVLIPSLPINAQKQIVKTLKQIDYEIKTKENSLRSYDELIKSRFIELFMDGDKDKYPLSDWETVVTIKHGRDYKKNLAESGGYPVYGSGGFMGVYADNYLVNEEATIIGRKGTIDKPIFVNEKFWNVDTAFGIEVNKKVLNPLFFFVRSTLYDLRSFSTSTTLPSMTKDTLHKIKIGIPPLELQNGFANFVRQIDKSKFVVQQQIKDLKELLDKKMDEYFGGWEYEFWIFKWFNRF